MVTFGETGAGAGNVTIANGRIAGGKFTCPEAGTADSISFRTSGDGAAHDYKCALYKASDMSLVKATEENNATFHAWNVDYTCNFLAVKPTLSAQDYIIAAWVDAAHDISYSWSGTRLIRYDDEAYDGFPATFADSELAQDAKLMTIYCTYTAGGGVTVKKGGNSALLQAFLSGRFFSRFDPISRFPRFIPRTVI